MLGRSVLRASALDAAGALAHDQGDLAAAGTLHRESTVLWREIGDDCGLANALNLQGIAAMDGGDYDAAMRSYEEALPLYRAARDLVGAARVSTNRLRSGRL
jgi:tetratricopeptide (TPR) repeat protein